MKCTTDDVPLMRKVKNFQIGETYADVYTCQAITLLSLPDRDGLVAATYSDEGRVLNCVKYSCNLQEVPLAHFQGKPLYKGDILHVRTGGTIQVGEVQATHIRCASSLARGHVEELSWEPFANKPLCYLREDKRTPFRSPVYKGDTVWLADGRSYIADKYSTLLGILYLSHRPDAYNVGSAGCEPIANLYAHPPVLTKYWYVAKGPAGIGAYVMGGFSSAQNRTDSIKSMPEGTRVLNEFATTEEAQ